MAQANWWLEGEWLKTAVEPIKNPVTGADHRIQVNMPQGFKFGTKGSHSSLARVVQTPQGVAA